MEPLPNVCWRTNMQAESALLLHQSHLACVKLSELAETEKRTLDTSEKYTIELT